VQVETAQWIAENQTWAPPLRTFSTVYRPDDQAEQMQHPDIAGSATHYEFDYDANGRPTAIWSLSDSGDVEQTAYSYDEGARSVRIAQVTREPETAPPPPAYGVGFTLSTTWVSVNISDDSYDLAGATSILTIYDSQNRPIEVSYFWPAGQQLQARKTLRWDSDGRLAHDQLILAIGDLVPDSMPHWETTYQYDSEGREIERRRRLGPDFEVRTTFAYDGHGNVVESIDSGKAPAFRHIRYEYRYDDRGNWIERVTRNRSNSGFDPMLKEVRQIEY